MKHCSITRKEEGDGFKVILRDFSSNGTFVNGTKVGKNNEKEIHDGDEIFFLNLAKEKIKVKFRLLPSEKHDISPLKENPTSPKENSMVVEEPRGMEDINSKGIEGVQNEKMKKRKKIIEDEEEYEPPSLKEDKKESSMDFEAPESRANFNKVPPPPSYVLAAQRNNSRQEEKGEENQPKTQPSASFNNARFSFPKTKAAPLIRIGQGNKMKNQESLLKAGSLSMIPPSSAENSKKEQSESHSRSINQAEDTSQSGMGLKEKPREDEKVIVDPPAPITVPAPAETEGKTPGGNEAAGIFNDEIENLILCPICYEVLYKSVAVSCTHNFCKLCLYEWIQKKKADDHYPIRCPKCNEEIKSYRDNCDYNSLIEIQTKLNPSWKRSEEEIKRINGKLEEFKDVDLSLEKKSLVGPTMTPFPIQMGPTSFGSAFTTNAFQNSLRMFSNGMASPGTFNFSPATHNIAFLSRPAQARATTRPGRGTRTNARGTRPNLSESSDSDSSSSSSSEEEQPKTVAQKNRKCKTKLKPKK